MHLAKLNVGRLKAPIDDPMIKDFRMNWLESTRSPKAAPGTCGV
jgi:hypothetical protein